MQGSPDTWKGWRRAIFGELLGIRPILSDNCFLCHGPDQSTRMAGLRLDIRDGVFSKRPNGVPIVPGKSEQSLLYQRIAADNPARRMPPASNGNVIFGNSHAGPANPQLIEVTRDKKVVWTFKNFETFGNNLVATKVIPDSDGARRH